MVYPLTSYRALQTRHAEPSSRRCRAGGGGSGLRLRLWRLCGDSDLRVRVLPGSAPDVLVEP